MAGGKIKGISKKEGGEIQKFEWGQLGVMKGCCEKKKKNC